MANREALQDYERNSPYYGVNNARMRNDGNDYRESPVVRKTLFVEGDDDKKFFRSYLKDGSKWVVEIANKKSGVLTKYHQYRKLPTNEGTSFFCADLDYEHVVNSLLNPDKEGQVVRDDCFFYQLYDLKDCRGFNDMESCLFLTDAYRNVMTEFYEDDKVISSIRSKILKIGLLMGSYRVANILIRKVNRLPDDASMLCHRRKKLSGEKGDASSEVTKVESNSLPGLGLTKGAKFSVCFMHDFGLVDDKKLFCPSGDDIDGALVREFSFDEFGNYMPDLVGLAAGIRVELSKNRSATFSFLRGHDLMELLVLKLLADKKMHLKGDRQWGDPMTFTRRYHILEDLRDELESRFRLAAGSSLDEIRKFPIGKILK